MNLSIKSKQWFALMITILVIIIAVIFILVKKMNIASEQQVQPVATVEIGHVQSLPIAKTLTAYGVVGFAPEHLHQLSLQNEIVVQKMMVNQGQHIHKGQPLLQVVLSNNAQLTLTNASIDAEFSKIERDRQLQLRSQYLATNMDVRTQTQLLAKSEALITRNRQEHLGSKPTIIRAELTGIVVALNVQQGQVVAPGSVLLTVARTQPMQVRLGIEPEDVAKVHTGQQVTLAPLYSNALTLTESIATISGQIDPATGLCDAIVPLHHAETLIAGTMVRGNIVLQKQMNVLVVPHQAILTEHNKNYIYVDVHGRAQKRMIEIDEDNGEVASIRRGVNENDAVIIVGQYELQDGMLLRIRKTS
jgi:membrane fusion protein (multidrug efflux system)